MRTSNIVSILLLVVLMALSFYTLRTKQDFENYKRAMESGKRTNYEIIVDSIDSITSRAESLSTFYKADGFITYVVQPRYGKKFYKDVVCQKFHNGFDRLVYTRQFLKYEYDLDHAIQQSGHKHVFEYQYKDTINTYGLSYKVFVLPIYRHSIQVAELHLFYDTRRDYRTSEEQLSRMRKEADMFIGNYFR